MFEEGELNFESDDEVFKGPPSGTIANVQVRAEKDKELGDFKTGKSEYGPWMAVPFEVVDGEFKGTWCSMMVSIDTKNKRFRRVFEVATGIDISEGGSIGFNEFKQRLIDGVFKASIGPDQKNPDFTRVERLEERVGERTGAAPGASSDTDAPGEDGPQDDDIPF